MRSLPQSTPPLTLRRSLRLAGRTLFSVGLVVSVAAGEALLAEPAPRLTPISQTRLEVSGVAVAGRDRSEIQLHAELPVQEYSNVGYRLRLDPEHHVATVEVDLQPLRSDSAFVTSKPSRSDDRFETLAHAVTAGATDHYDAVSRILSWVSRNIRYELDRTQDQTAEAVLDRRTGYCTGVARLTVALLAAVEIEAREIPGVVAVPSPGQSYFHRWVEIYYPQRGWAFSDPLSSHHHVPANYLPLAKERLVSAPRPAIALLRRDDQRQEIDVYQEAARGVAARRNDDRQRRAALTIEFRGAAPESTAVLIGDGLRRQLRLRRGQGTFVGLSPGRYRLEVEDRYDERIVRELVLPGFVRRTLYLTSNTSTQGAKTRGR